MNEFLYSLLGKINIGGPICVAAYKKAIFITGSASTFHRLDCIILSLIKDPGIGTCTGIFIGRGPTSNLYQAICPHCIGVDIRYTYQVEDRAECPIATCMTFSSLFYLI